MNIPGMTKFKSFNDFNASASKEVDKLRLPRKR